MMKNTNLFILDADLKPLHVIDEYRSLIWTQRYRAVGGCELYVEADTPAAAFLTCGNYLVRPDDFQMVCRINRVELDVDAEEGNYLIVNGKDAKCLIDQRIIWGTYYCNGNVENFVRSLVISQMIGGASAERQMRKPNDSNYYLLTLGDSAGLTDVITEQVSYKNLGEKIRDYCTVFGWGYRAKFDTTSESFKFELYKGTDRIGSVVFSEKFENLSETKNVYDATNLGNVALIGGEGEGKLRALSTYGNGESGVNRYESFIDAKDMSSKAKYGDITTTFPGGQIKRATSTEYVYTVNPLDVIILDSAQLAALRIDYPDGSVVTIDGVVYYRMPNRIVASVGNNPNPPNDAEVLVSEVVYDTFMQARAAEKMAEYGAITTFEGTIIPDITYTFNSDYYLGDIVGIDAGGGSIIPARIIEMTETIDETGYRLDPTYELID